MATTIWKGHIAFGLVSSPVRPQAAARSVSVSFNQLHQYDYSRFKQVLLPGRNKPGPLPVAQFARRLRRTLARSMRRRQRTGGISEHPAGTAAIGVLGATSPNEDIVRSMILTTVAFLLPAAWLAAQSEPNTTVKVTPLGSKTGEFCFLDRAMIFEDPTGVRILYDPGFTVAGSTDPRLGNIDVTLLSHAHADHIGTGKLNQNPDASTAVCSAAFPQMPTVPNSDLAEITAEKHAVFVGTPALAPFIGAKMQAVLGTPVGYCCGANNSPVPVGCRRVRPA